VALAVAAPASASTSGGCLTGKLDWDGLKNEEQTGKVLVPTGSTGVTVTVTTTGDDTADGNGVVTATTTGGLSKVMRFTSRNNKNNTVQQVTVTFSKPVRNVSFSLLDVDSQKNQGATAYEDLVTILTAGWTGRPWLRSNTDFARFVLSCAVGALVGAILDRRPTVIHEQNAVMGRANRMLAPHVRTVACAFPTLAKAPPKVAAGAVVVGNPVRPPIRALADHPYAPPERDGPVRLLVTGGSQGARLLSELTPEAVKLLPEGLRQRLAVAQQTRPESMNLARRAYRDANVEAEIAPFFRDIASRLRDAHLVIGRAGAGTVCEFAVAGKPSILIPLAIALDDDQGQNARLLAEAGGAEVAREAQLTVESLAKALEKLLGDPARLARMAERARAVAIPDAAERLADVVEETARRG